MDQSWGSSFNTLLCGSRKTQRHALLGRELPSPESPPLGAPGSCFLKSQPFSERTGLALGSKTLEWHLLGSRIHLRATQCPLGSDMHRCSQAGTEPVSPAARPGQGPVQAKHSVWLGASVEWEGLWGCHGPRKADDTLPWTVPLRPPGADLPGPSAGEEQAARQSLQGESSSGRLDGLGRRGPGQHRAGGRLQPGGPE